MEYLTEKDLKDMCIIYVNFSEFNTDENGNRVKLYATIYIN